MKSFDSKCPKTVWEPKRLRQTHDDTIEPALNITVTGIMLAPEHKSSTMSRDCLASQ